MDSKYNIPKDSTGARRATEKRIYRSRRTKNLSEKYNFEKAVIIGSRLDFIRDVEAIRQKFGIKNLESQVDMITTEKPGGLFETHSMWLDTKLTDRENREFAIAVYELIEKYNFGNNFYEALESVILYDTFDRLPRDNFTEHLGGTEPGYEWHIFNLNGPVDLKECQEIIKSKPTIEVAPGDNETKEALFSYEDFGFKFIKDTGVLQFKIFYFKNEDADTIKRNKKLFPILIHEISKKYFEMYRPVAGIKTDAKIANYYIEVMNEKKDFSRGLKTGQIEFYEDQLKNVCKEIATRIWTSSNDPNEIKKHENQVKKRLSRHRTRQQTRYQK